MNIIMQDNKKKNNKIIITKQKLYELQEGDISCYEFNKQKIGRVRILIK